MSRLSVRDSGNDANMDSYTIDDKIFHSITCKKDGSEKLNSSEQKRVHTSSCVVSERFKTHSIYSVIEMHTVQRRQRTTGMTCKCRLLTREQLLHRINDSPAENHNDR